MNSTTLAPMDAALEPPRTLSAGPGQMAQTIADLNAVRQFVAKQLKEGLDYGRIPGTGGKRTLLQPGAQKIMLYFNCYCTPTVKTRELDDGHVEYLVRCRVLARPSQAVVGVGLGSCSTLESRYRWRKDRRGVRMPNPDVADCRNTALKMAKKRAVVDAALSLGCLSECFTQDLEDQVDDDDRPATAASPRRSAPPAAPPPSSRWTSTQQAARARLDFKAYLTDRMDRARKDWQTELILAGVPRDRMEDDALRPPNVHRVLNHMGTTLLAAGLIDEAAVSKPGRPGVRDRDRLRSELKDVYSDSPRRFAATVDAYLADALEEARGRAAAALDPTASPPDDQADDDEDFADVGELFADDGDDQADDQADDEADDDEPIRTREPGDDDDL